MRTALATATVLTCVIFLAGCAGSPAIEETPVASPTSTPSETPVEEPTAEPAALTCETLMGAERFAGATIAGQDYLDKIRAEGAPIVQFLDYGGILCAVQTGNEIGAFYAFSLIGEAEQAAEEARLVSEEALVASSVDGGTLYSTPDAAANPYALSHFFRDGNWWMASTPESVALIVANWPGV